MAKQVMPEARIEPRPTDVKLTEEQFHKLSLFAQLKRKPSVDKFPGALVLRRFETGEVMFRQGEAGWTAFYILTTEDGLALMQMSLGAAIDENRRRDLLQRIARLKQHVEYLKTVESDDAHRRVANVHLAIARPSRGVVGGLLGSVKRRLFGPADPEAAKPAYIPIDAPRGVDFKSLQAPLFEGELFGEMSCLYRTPRSATIVATRTCYMLEMMRNIFDQLLKDPAYKAQMDNVYRKRVLQLQLRQLPIFSELSEAQFVEVRNSVELVSKEPGELICDEHERPDGMYIVRGGLVKLVKKVSALLSEDSIRSWPAFATALLEGEKKTNEPAGKVWQLLAAPAKTCLQKVGKSEQLADVDRKEILFALNDLIKDRKFGDHKEFTDLPKGVVFQERLKDLPENRKTWSDHEHRRYNRMILEAAYPNSLRVYRRRVGPECVLSYAARGEFIGEDGLMENQPRDATCVAYGHPTEGANVKETGRVELVRIPEVLFRRIMEASPATRQKVEKKIAERAKQARKQVSVPVWDEGSQVTFSKEFERLGLIQGQRLMLIDLDRCTRCDECVRACVNTHSDGHSRLFLDGPRFGKYLVPTSCRSCLDPVCMINCPVGSIHRGDNGQIIIEDWCIGCGLCASQCPYGSIQMHDIGVIAENSLGWRFVPAAAVRGEHWHQRRFRDHRWALGQAPFHYDREFRDRLAEFLNKKGADVSARERAVYFRYEFRLPRYLLHADSHFKLELSSSDPSPSVYLNGKELHSEKPKGGKRDYWVPPKPAEGAGGGKARDVLRVGRNVLAIKVTPNPSSDAVMMQARLDEVRRPVGAPQQEDVTEKLVTERAVVCDLCSSAPRQIPACVHACPHDAAMRVDARFEFPVK